MYRLLQSLKETKGFSLIEVSVALVIMGMVIAISTTVYSRFGDSAKSKNTKEYQESLLGILGQYALLNSRLPYAANPDAPKETFGLEEPKRTVGLIPYRTLGIPESMAKDAYGNFFTYAISPFPERTTARARERVNFCSQFPTGTSLDFTENGHKVNPVYQSRENQDFVALVIVSHGKNGYGAYAGSPGSIYKRDSGVHGKEEEINADGTMNFVTRPYSQNEEDYFDDHVQYITRNNLALKGGGSCYQQKSKKSELL